MCDCWCSCKAPGLKSKDELCVSCNRGMHVVPQNKKELRKPVPIKKPSTAVRETRLCVDCREPLRVIVARYGEHKGQKVDFCRNCKVIGLFKPKMPA